MKGNNYEPAILPSSFFVKGWLCLYMCMCVPMSKRASVEVPVEARRRYWISWSWGTGDYELLGFELGSSLLRSKHSLALLLFETELNFPRLARIYCVA